MNIRLQIFKGSAPMLDDGLLHNEQAVVAKDVDLRNGSMRSLCAPSKIKDIADGAKTVYWWRGGARWIESANVAHFVESALADDAWRRLYSSMEYSAGNLRMRYSLGGHEKNVALGVIAPEVAATIETVSKNSTTWTRRWGWYWEEPDGTISGVKTLFAEQDPGWDGIVVGTVPGSEYSIPATIVSAVTVLKPAEASASAALFFFFEAISGSGAILGRVYPESSGVSADSDLFINGFKVSAIQAADGSDIGFSLSYDETDVEEYTADRVYLFSYVDEIGEESAPSPASAMLSVRPDVDVKVTFPAFAQPADRASVTKRRVYRTVTASTSTAYQFVADVPILDADFTDSLTDLEVGESIPSVGWIPPEQGLRGLISVPGGSLAAYKGRNVHFSAPDAPHAWKDEYVVAVDSDIRGLAVVGNSVYVLTDKHPELITVASPSTTERSPLPFAQNCTSELSIVTASGGVLFASPDGICQMVGMSVVILSQAYLSKERWRQMQTDSSGTERQAETAFAVYDELLYIFAAGGSWTWDLVRPDRGLVELSVRATAAQYVPEEDGLFMACGKSLMRWSDSDAEERLEAVWRSKRFGFTKPIRFRRARISCEGEAKLILRDYAGNPVYEILRKNSNSFLLPPLNPMRWWCIELRSKSIVTEFSIGTSSAEM